MMEEMEMVMEMVNAKQHGRLQYFTTYCIVIMVSLVVMCTYTIDYFTDNTLLLTFFKKLMNE